MHIKKHPKKIKMKCKPTFGVFAEEVPRPSGRTMASTPT